MLSLLDVAERTRQGPRWPTWTGTWASTTRWRSSSGGTTSPCPPNTWDHLCNDDEALVERAIQAGIDFLVEQGAYCIQTGRAIRSPRPRSARAWPPRPRQVVIGEGDDATVMGAGPIDLPPCAAPSISTDPLRTRSWWT